MIHMISSSQEFELAKSYAFNYSPENRCILGDLTLRPGRSTPMAQASHGLVSKWEDPPLPPPPPKKRTRASLELRFETT